MKKILVTGADGFIGSHLVEALLARGYSVRALACYNSFNSWGWLEDVGRREGLEVVSGDVRDPLFCHHLVEGMDAVMHLAALIAIPYSYQAPDSYVDTNIRGTLNICNAARAHKIKKFVHTSTSEVYGTARYVPIDEAHPMQPQSPYSASKIAADAMAMSYFHAFNLPVTVARPFNTYGPRQSARAVIPTIITQIAAGMREIKLGDVTPTRDFNFVEDTCRGLIAILEAEKTAGETINIGSNSEVTVLDTLKLIRELMGSGVEFVLDPQRIRPEGSEVHRLWCDNTKLRQLTGYSPAHDLRAGLTKTIAWFTVPENLRNYKADVYNV
jgi:NAD dependent epimerase/dehydratase